MAGEWTTVTLSDAPMEIIDGDRGTNYPKQQDFAQSGHCLFLNAGNVTTTGFNFSDCAFISAEKDSKLRKGKLMRHDIVLTTRGTVGNVAYYDESVPYDHIRINSGMVIFRAQPRKLHPRFLYLFLKSFLFRCQVESLRTGSAQPQLPIRDINRIDIPIPPLSEQQAIAHILGTLDDKIELNRQMNKTLEEMARAIFKSWFVDFDPVHAKAAVRREHPDWTNAQISRVAHLNLKPEIAELFPDSFDDSELGKIPKGWKDSTVGQNFRLTMGQSPPGSTYNENGEGIPFYQGRSDFGCRFPSRRVFCTAPTRFAEPGDTLVSVRAPVGDVNIANERCAVGRGVAAILHCNGNKSFTYYSMKHLKDYFDKFEAEGTVFGSINKSDFENLPFTMPSSDVLESFERIASPLDNRIKTNECESNNLSATRDALLPKLISGELRVVDLEKMEERYT
ncbi:MAG TPA: restriction endonuclease subunit S [Smithellaceae bacterium]|nr:restriction endonuclease subunit S [Smithellaceae bacterium]